MDRGARAMPAASRSVVRERGRVADVEPCRGFGRCREVLSARRYGDSCRQTRRQWMRGLLPRRYGARTSLRCAGAGYHGCGRLLRRRFPRRVGIRRRLPGGGAIRERRGGAKCTEARRHYRDSITRPNDGVDDLGPDAHTAYFGTAAARRSLESLCRDRKVPCRGRSDFELAVVDHLFQIELAFEIERSGLYHYFDIAVLESNGGSRCISAREERVDVEPPRGVAIGFQVLRRQHLLAFGLERDRRLQLVRIHARHLRR